MNKNNSGDNADNRTKVFDAYKPPITNQQRNTPADRQRTQGTGNSAPFQSASNRQTGPQQPQQNPQNRQVRQNQFQTTPQRQTIPQNQYIQRVTPPHTQQPVQRSVQQRPVQNSAAAPGQRQPTAQPSVEHTRVMPAVPNNTVRNEPRAGQAPPQQHNQQTAPRRDLSGQTRVMPAVSSNNAHPSNSINPAKRQPSTNTANPRRNLSDSSASSLTPANRLTPSTGTPRGERHPSVTPSKRTPLPSHGGGGRKPPLNRPENLDDYKYQDRDSAGEVVGGTLSSVFKAIIYIVSVLVISAFLSVFGISVCNDVFAFIKDASEIEVVIPEYANIDDVAKVLKATGIIEYPTIFKLYAKLRKSAENEYVAGSYTVTPSMNYDQLLSEFIEQTPERTEISVTIPEGYTIDQIISLFVDELGMGTREGFVKALDEFEWDYWFVQELNGRDLSSSRKYKLEGYLYPDTYYYFSDSNETTIIWKMLENFNDKFAETMRERCTELGYSVDQIITLASMIQMEAKFRSEYPDIASVFHNRLNHPSGETQGRLQSDPTIMYVLEGHRTNLTQEEKDMDNPYNTYIYKGLPPGPISNPSLDAISCALYPNETNYYYFYALQSGYHIFAQTYAEQVQNIIDATKGTQ